MGWTGTHRDRKITTEDYFANEFGDGRDGGRGIVRCMGVGFDQAYAAYRCENGDVIGIVILTKWIKDDYYNFMFKDISEDMGPCEANCPKAILDLLTPMTDPGEGDSSAQWAWEWRQRCYANLEARKAATKAKVGDVIVFDRPVRFTNGAEFDRMKLAHKSPMRFNPTDGGLYGGYRLSKSLLQASTWIRS